MPHGLVKKLKLKKNKDEENTKEILCWVSAENRQASQAAQW